MNQKNLNESFQKLIEIVAQLRGPQGCPWDKEQTQRSLCQYILEEAHELVEAIEAPASEQKQTTIKDELGDFLFQVVLQAQVAKDLGFFDIEDVIKNLSDKMIRRHPHVFSSTENKDLEQIWKKWEEIKKLESPSKTVFSYPRSMPALQAALKIGIKTESWKFDWNQPEDVIEKIKEELDETIEAMEHVKQAHLPTRQQLLNSDIKTKPFPPTNELEPEMAHLEHEIGDLLFATAQLARKYNIDPEQSLRRANARFENRFEKMLEVAELSKDEFRELNLAEKEQLWSKAKVLTKSSSI